MRLQSIAYFFYRQRPRIGGGESIGLKSMYSKTNIQYTLWVAATIVSRCVRVSVEEWQKCHEQTENTNKTA